MDQRVRAPLRIGLRASDDPKAPAQIEWQRIGRLLAGVDRCVGRECERVIEQTGAKTAAMKIRVDEQGVDFIPVHDQEPDDQPVVILRQPQRGVGQELLGNHHVNVGPVGRRQWAGSVKEFKGGSVVRDRFVVGELGEVQPDSFAAVTYVEDGYTRTSAILLFP